MGTFWAGTHAPLCARLAAAIKSVEVATITLLNNSKTTIQEDLEFSKQMCGGIIIVLAYSAM